MQRFGDGKVSIKIALAQPYMPDVLLRSGFLGRFRLNADENANTSHFVFMDAAKERAQLNSGIL